MSETFSPLAPSKICDKVSGSNMATLRFVILFNNEAKKTVLALIYEKYLYNKD